MQEERFSAGEIVSQFVLGGEVVEIKECSGGKINDTLLIILASGERRILQRLNPMVFAAPVQVMRNLRVITEEMTKRLPLVVRPGERWEIPRLFKTKDGRDFFTDQAGGVWRVMAFIGNARAYSSVQSLDHAREAGVALGHFHCLLADLEPGLLADTLPGFHITPGYLRRYDQVLVRFGRLPEAALPLARFIAERRSLADLLEDPKNARLIKPRIMHGDPRLNNIMIDELTGRAVALIDLDTVKPGLIQYDLGDLLRSACNPAGGEAADFKAVRFDADLYRAILTGYLASAGSVVSEPDLAVIPASVLVIAFELGLRYFTDYLEGNVYFKTVTPSQNLHRAAVQFKLVELIEAAMPQLAAIVKELR